MTKHTTTLPLSLPVPRSGTPLYHWFYEELRSAILEGRLKPGARLPATRDLARQYGLSRATVVTAFEQLKSEGYVQGKVGAGTYVTQVLPDELLQVGGISYGGASQPRRVALSDYPPRVKALPGTRVPPARAFPAHPAAVDGLPTLLLAHGAAPRRPP